MNFGLIDLKIERKQTMKTTDKFVFFYGGFMSQWYPSQFSGFNCAEQWMMLMKAIYFGDLESVEKICKTSNPAEQKKLGRKVKNFDPIRWNDVARDIVFAGNLLKFTQNEGLKQMLLDTGDRILVEASPYDKIWGIGLSEDDPNIEDASKWLGTNWLGHVLMEVREYFKSNRGIEDLTVIEALQLGRDWPELWVYYDQGGYLEDIE